MPPPQMPYWLDNPTRRVILKEGLVGNSPFKLMGLICKQGLVGESPFSTFLAFWLDNPIREVILKRGLVGNSPFKLLGVENSFCFWLESPAKG